VTPEITSVRDLTMYQSESDFKICESHLAKVSRTFALNIRVLRGNQYRSMLLAYLLCRIADTLEDDPALSPGVKIGKLRQYAELFPPERNYRERIDQLIGDLTLGQLNHDAELVRDAHRVFSEFVKLPDRLVAIVSSHVKEMAIGMAGFQHRTSGQAVAFLENLDELEQYCYFVAGTVGLMITSIFRDGTTKITGKIYEQLHARSVAFGLGLQLTNIAKDFFGDRDRGWCYVPRSFFHREGIDPVADPFRLDQGACIKVYKRLITLALAYLDDALLYTLDLPRSLVRYRLFCLWPLFMAVETLARLGTEPDALYHGTIIKINRSDVYRIILSTTSAVLSDRLLRTMYGRVRRRVADQLLKQ